jgi:hypothetical protein
MNREDIIRMAIEAKLNMYVNDLTEKQYIEVLEHFTALVSSAEREACAKVADTISDKYGWGHYGNEVDTADEIATAIRARGQA